MARRAAPLAALLLCSACSQPDNPSAAGGVSAGEARALDDAAQMVEDQQLPPEAIPKPQAPPAPRQPAATGQPAGKARP